MKEIHEGPIEVVASTVAKAIKLVTLQLKGFRPTALRGHRRVAVVGCRTFESLFEEGGGPEEIHLVPQLTGGKSGGILQIIIGAVLIAAAVFASTIPALALFAPILASAGLLLLVGGILQLMQTPTNYNKSHYLGAPQNTTAIGTPIAVLYGHRLVGGQILSINIEAVSV